MKIVLTGGGTGGHFYPIIAVAEALQKQAAERKLVDLELYYLAPQKYDEALLFENKIKFVPIPAGKVRRYFSFLNFGDFFRTIFGVIASLRELYRIYPDVVFSKGGYVAFPVVWAARILSIPVVIHESDSAPGKTNLWSGKFARKVAVSFPEAAHYFKADKVAVTGNPIRQALTVPATKDSARELFNLEPGVPVIVVLGGSQGAQIINETILDALPNLLQRYHVIHQVGAANKEVTQKTIEVILATSKFRSRYIFFDHMNLLTQRAAAGVADIIVSRAGSTIFEIATWGVPSIIIPITKTNGDHQRKNAYNYARTGAALVMEENNLTPHILASEIDRLMEHEEIRANMRQAAKQFARTDAATLIANELIAIGLEHEE
jgi:UDP-N-acetylglucosamine--N-acetylmuramyl-(pentapeptide) pyrophosphoryl-undecaprenol N-acetylglucosamine transferase